MTDRTISHYHLVEKLGESRTSIVYTAEDLDLQRIVVLKVLRANFFAHSAHQKRVLRAVRAAASLRHPNICTVYEVGEADRQIFIAREFIQGESLDQRIARGPLPIKNAVDIGRQVALGLQAAHQMGIIHRDIRPANLMLARDGHVTIIDFALATFEHLTELRLTVPFIGTSAYMSPEQLIDWGTDERTDIWSLGAVLYEMLAGEPPFKGSYDTEVFYEVINSEPKPLPIVRPDIPTDLERIVAKCMAKNRDERYATATHVLIQLQGLAPPSVPSSPLALAEARAITRHRPPKPYPKVATSDATNTRSAFLRFGLSIVPAIGIDELLRHLAGLVGLTVDATMPTLALEFRWLLSAVLDTIVVFPLFNLALILLSQRSGVASSCRSSMSDLLSYPLLRLAGLGGFLMSFLLINRASLDPFPVSQFLYFLAGFVLLFEVAAVFVMVAGKGQHAGL